MKHVSQKSLPFLTLNFAMNDHSLLTSMEHSKHLMFFNIPVKNMLLFSLLMTSSFIVSSSSEYEKWKKIIDQESQTFIASRNDKKTNGTPLEKTTITLTDLSVNSAGIVMSIGLCSYVVDNALVIFDTTKNIPNRRTIASGACTTVCTALYASFKYEEMKKFKELQKAQELAKIKELHNFFGSQVSIEVQNFLASQKAEELQKANELKEKVDNAGYYGWWFPSSIK